MHTTLDAGTPHGDSGETGLEEPDEGLCTWQVGGGYHSPPEYCELDIEGDDAEYCPKHEELAARMRKWEAEAGLDNV